MLAFGVVFADEGNKENNVGETMIFCIGEDLTPKTSFDHLKATKKIKYFLPSNEYQLQEENDPPVFKTAFLHSRESPDDVTVLMACSQFQELNVLRMSKQQGLLDLLTYSDERKISKV